MIYLINWPYFKIKTISGQISGGTDLTHTVAGKGHGNIFSNSRPWLTISRHWLTNTRHWLTNSRPWLTISRPWLKITNSRPWLTKTRHKLRSIFIFYIAPNTQLQLEIIHKQLYLQTLFCYTPVRIQHLSDFIQNNIWYCCGLPKMTCFYNVQKITVVNFMKSCYAILKQTLL
jgi:hypothetical protein